MPPAARSPGGWLLFGSCGLLFLLFLLLLRVPGLVSLLILLLLCLLILLSLLFLLLLLTILGGCLHSPSVLSLFCWLLFPLLGLVYPLFDLLPHKLQVVLGVLVIGIQIQCLLIVLQASSSFPWR